ncbi:MAG: toll/interleukin-1 receptor domain-containing protein [Clostridia bacterium]|nr:toll/interleukin-1 receptor domain-containing protein [Clostridia bacterium]
MDEWLYDAFISYSHRDLRWGKWLQRKLETFPLPRRIRQERESGRHHLRVFRDQTDLAGVELQGSLQQSLRQSRCLIVICSTASAGSRWVGEEIRYFKSLGREDRIIPFVVDGEPESDYPERECYHPELRNIPEKHLLGANVLELGRNKAFLRLTAILLDVRFDRLVNRERKRRQKWAAGIGGTVAAIAGVFGILMWHNARMADRNRALSRETYGGALVEAAQNEVFSEDDVESLIISAEAGNPMAMIFLADCYQHGKGVGQSFETAFEWYRRAAEAGEVRGMLETAICYALGLGCEQSETEAFVWYQRAAEAGSPEGMVSLANLYLSGIGTEQNPAMAFENYLRAAELDSREAMLPLASCYLLGIGTEQNAEAAFRWISKLAELGDPDGMYNLALLYQQGIGTEENPEEAYRWYRKAAEAGDPNGMYMTAWCIENHYGVISPALDWYRRAAELGLEEAGKEAERILAGLDGATPSEAIP